MESVGRDLERVAPASNRANYIVCHPDQLSRVCAYFNPRGGAVDETTRQNEDLTKELLESRELIKRLEEKLRKCQDALRDALYRAGSQYDR